MLQIRQIVSIGRNFTVCIILVPSLVSSAFGAEALRGLGPAILGMPEAQFRTLNIGAKVSRNDHGYFSPGDSECELSNLSPKPSLKACYRNIADFGGIKTQVFYMFSDVLYEIRMHQTYDGVNWADYVNVETPSAGMCLEKMNVGASQIAEKYGQLDHAPKKAETNGASINVTSYSTEKSFSDKEIFLDTRYSDLSPGNIGKNPKDQLSDQCNITVEYRLNVKTVNPF